jgi:hypothetical protein
MKTRLIVAAAIGSLALAFINFSVADAQTTGQGRQARSCPSGQTWSGGAGRCIPAKQKQCWQQAGLPAAQGSLPNHPGWPKYLKCMGRG